MYILVIWTDISKHMIDKLYAKICVRYMIMDWTDVMLHVHKQIQLVHTFDLFQDIFTGISF